MYACHRNTEFPDIAGHDFRCSSLEMGILVTVSSIGAFWFIIHLGSCFHGNVRGISRDSICLDHQREYLCQEHRVSSHTSAESNKYIGRFFLPLRLCQAILTRASEAVSWPLASMPCAPSSSQFGLSKVPETGFFAKAACLGCSQFQGAGRWSPSFAYLPDLSYETQNRLPLLAPLETPACG